MNFLVSLLAQDFTINGQHIKGPIQLPDGNTNPQLGDIISLVISFLIPLASIVLFFVLILGGFDYMFSQGNPDKIKGAQAKLTTGIVGFVLLIASYLIVRIISTIFGLGEGILR